MSNKATEIRIVSAAMRMKDNLIVTGVRHFSPDMRATLLRIYGEGYHRLVEEQGFITNFGEFLGRKAAYKIANENGQFNRTSGTGVYDSKVAKFLLNWLGAFFHRRNTSNFSSYHLPLY